MFTMTMMGSTTQLNFGPGASFHTTDATVTNARVVAIPDSPVRLILWEETSETLGKAPFYAISLDGAVVDYVTETSYALKLSYGTFDPCVETPKLPAGLIANAKPSVYIVQFVTQPLEEFRAAIMSLGGTVYGFLPHHAHVVKMSPEVRDKVATLPYVRWVGPFEPAYRVAPALLSELAAIVNSGEERKYSFMLHERGSCAQNAVAEAITSLGGRVDLTIPEGFRLEATLTLDQLADIVRHDEVAFVDVPGELGVDMNNAREVSGANFVENTPGAFKGQGVTGEVMDTEITNHSDFTPAPIPGLIHGDVDPSAPVNHGTRVFGIVFGDGIGNPNARGLLREGIGVFAYQDALSNRYVHTAELLQSPWYAVFQTNSWGSEITTAYTTKSSELDDVIFIDDVLLCQSQGNQGNGCPSCSCPGTSCSRPEAWSKNVVSVGAFLHHNDADHTDDRWCFGAANPYCVRCPSFNCLPPAQCPQGCFCSCRTGFCASRGPAPNGRVKPDLTHFVDCVATTDDCGPNCYFNTFGGTSAATPITCGYAGLVFQMWHESVFNVWNGTTSVPTGGGASVFDDRPHATTVKAMLINTAYRYPLQTEPPHYRPDFTRDNMGWGMVDVAALYEQRNNMFIVNETDVLTFPGKRTYIYTVPSGSPVLRVTMVYADPPGVPCSTDNLVNDVSLKAISPSGTVYWGNYGLVNCPGTCPPGYFVGNWSVADATPLSPDKDHVNNVENVFIKNPQAGNWSIIVSVDQIAQDGHVETQGINDVDYALVVSSGARPRGRCCECNPTLTCTWTTQAACTGPSAEWSSEATCADPCLDICAQ